MRWLLRACAPLVCPLAMLGQAATLPTAPAAQATEADFSAPEGLPLPTDTLQELRVLSSLSNDATEAMLPAGDAGEEDEDTGSGAPRGAEHVAAASNGGASYSGLPAVFNETTLDGLTVQQSFRSGTMGQSPGGARGGASYSGSAVQVVRVAPYTFALERFSARYGGAGGVVAAETARGTEQLHGRLEWVSQESALAAINPYSIATHYANGTVTSDWVKPHGVANQWSAAAGMPLGRLLGSRVPGPWQRGVVLFGALDAELRNDAIVSTPAATSFFALTAEQLALLGTRGVSSAATSAALSYLDSLTGTTQRSALRLVGLGRVDLGLGARDRLALVYAGNRVTAPAGAALGQASDAVVARGTGSLGDSYVGVNTGSLRWAHTPGPRWTDEVRAQWVHDLEYETPRPSLPQEPGIGPGGLAPQVSIAPQGFAYGTPANLGRSAYPDEHRVEVTEQLRVVAGRSEITLGGSWSRVDDRIASLDAEEGAFLYDSGTTHGNDGGLVDWITDYTFNVHAYPNGGCPGITAAVHDFCFRTYTQGFGVAQTGFVTHDVGAYAEQSWRVREGLKLTVGTRWDYRLLPLPANPNPLLDQQLAAVGVTGATGRFPEDRNNFGPRVAVSWHPAWLRAVTLQAGYGVYFGRVPGGTIRAALNDTALLSTSEHVRITPATETQCPQVTTVSQGFGYPCAFAATPPAAVAATTSAMVFAPNFRSPMVQRGMLGVERGWAHGLTLRVNGEVSVARQLPASTDVNIAPSTGLVSYVTQGGDAAGERNPGLHTGQTFVVPLYAQRLLLQYGPVTEIESNANAYYTAGTAEAEWRGPRGLAARGSYTFSRALDDGPQTSATPTENSQFDPFHDGYDKGLSGLQFPQRFAGALLATVRVAHGPRQLRQSLSGWRIAGIGTAGSGAPYSYVVFGGTRLSGGRESLNGSGGATYLPTVGRNTLRLPPRGRMDLRLGREFAAPHGLHANLFAEAFNLLNQRNLAGVETRAFLLGTTATIAGQGAAGLPQPLVFQDAAAVASEGVTTPPFATPTSSTSGSSKERRVQFGVRLTF